MDCTQYCVYPASVGGWLVRLNAGEIGPYHSRDMALRVAILDVLRERHSGRAARVTVKDERGAVCAERCLCDRFPYRRPPDPC